MDDDGWRVYKKQGSVESAAEEISIAIPENAV